MVSSGRAFECQGCKEVFDSMRKIIPEVKPDLSRITEHDRKYRTEIFWELFHDAGFDAIWYASGWPSWSYGHKGLRRFFAGTWTGPQLDLICVKECDTNEVANRWMSPEGKTPEDAIEFALRLLVMGPEEFDRTYPERRPGAHYEGKPGCEPCPHCGSTKTTIKGGHGFCFKCKQGAGSSVEVKGKI
jgi:hypothetical protein